MVPVHMPHCVLSQVFKNAEDKNDIFIEECLVKKKNTAVKKRSTPIKVKKRSRLALPKVPSKGAKQSKVKLSSKSKVKLSPISKVSKIRIPKKYRHLYEALVHLRDRLTRQINFLASDNLSRHANDAEVDFRSEEQGTDHYNRDFALHRVSQEQNIIFEIDQALHRIQIGAYGVCESCKCTIEQARMQALPYSRLCVACQAKMEAGRKHQRITEALPLFPGDDKIATEISGDDE